MPDEEKQEAVVEGEELDKEANDGGDEDGKGEEEGAETEAETEEEGSESEGDEGEPKEELIPVSKIQPRMDALTAIINRQQAQLDKLSEGSTKKEKGETEYTDDELRALKREKPEYAEWVDEQLIDRKVERKLAAKSEVHDFRSAVKDSYAKAKADFPEMSDTSSALWQTANKIYLERGLDKIADGQYIAAQLAYSQLNDISSKRTLGLEKKLAKERQKKALAGGSRSRAGGISPTAKLDKLEEAAIGTKANSPEWIAYLKAVEQARRTKSKGE